MESQEIIECLDSSPDCKGTVKYRMPLSGTGRAFPRCEHHWEKRLVVQEENDQKYGSPAPPSNFDPAYAGENWDED